MMTSILLRSYVGNGDYLVWLEDDNEGILRSQLAHTCGVGSGRRKHLIEGGSAFASEVPVIRWSLWVFRADVHWIWLQLRRLTVGLSICSASNSATMSTFKSLSQSLIGCSE